MSSKAEFHHAVWIVSLSTINVRKKEMPGKQREVQYGSKLSTPPGASVYTRFLRLLSVFNVPTASLHSQTRVLNFLRSTKVCVDSSAQACAGRRGGGGGGSGGSPIPSPLHCVPRNGGGAQRGVAGRDLDE